MLCKKYEKYILLSDLNELSADEQRDFKNHIESCDYCREKLSQQKEYAEIIKELKNDIPELKNPETLTNDILSAIPKRKPGKTVFTGTISFLRIAAIIIVVAFTGFFFQQKIYVKKQREYLAEKYSKTEAASPQIEYYSDCRVQSRKFIKNLMITDNEFSSNVMSLTSDISYNQIEKYSNTICLQNHEEFLLANTDNRKKIILDLLQQNSKIKTPENN